MFCPKCKTEYEDWVKECVECKISLIPKLSSEETQKDIENVGYIEYEEVLFTYNQQDVMMIKSVLENENVIFYFKGEHSNMLRPAVIPAILMVKKDQVDKVKDLLKGYTLNYNTLRANNKPKNNS